MARKRITRRIGETIHFIDGNNYSQLTHEEAVKLLFETLADCEDELEQNSASVMKSYFSLEDWLYGNGKDKPIEIKSAMLWGALWVAREHGDIDWNTMRNLYGEFMSKNMNLR